MQETISRPRPERTSETLIPKNLFMRVLKDDPEKEAKWKYLQPHLNNIRKVDPGITASHIKGVAHIARQFSRFLDLSPADVDIAELGGYMHDLGKGKEENGEYKFGNILNSTKRLSPQEHDFILQHAGDGAQILRELGMPGIIAEIAADHHKYREEGGIINNKFTGIVVIADVLEALTTTRRLYRKPASKSLAFKIFSDQILDKINDRQLRDSLPHWRPIFVGESTLLKAVS